MFDMNNSQWLASGGVPSGARRVRRVDQSSWSLFASSMGPSSMCPYYCFSDMDYSTCLDIGKVLSESTRRPSVVLLTVCFLDGSIFWVSMVKSHGQFRMVVQQRGLPRIKRRTKSISREAKGNGLFRIEKRSKINLRGVKGSHWEGLMCITELVFLASRKGVNEGSEWGYSVEKYKSLYQIVEVGGLYVDVSHSLWCSDCSNTY